MCVITLLQRKEEKQGVLLASTIFFEKERGEEKKGNLEFFVQKKYF